MKRNINKQQKVIVAMSGGVDSSVAAFLLREKGYQVIGTTFENGYGNPAERAAAICRQLGIEHQVIDIRDSFDKQVVRPFIESYLSGQTPNPCVLCNEKIKFPVFLPLLEQLEADFIATGHYVRLFEQGSRFILRQAVCQQKDQSYFMYRIPQHILAKCIFPLGEYTKEQVRFIAEENGLISAKQKDSYDICFIESGDYRQYLAGTDSNYLIPGEIVDSSGSVVGEHQGLAHYTIGQRRGVDVSLGYPAYVVKIDRSNNRLVLGAKEDLFTDTARVESLVFLPFDYLETPIKAEVKIRYKTVPVSAQIIPDTDSPRCAEIIFDAPVWSVTPGQSAVFYDGDMLLGGGYLK